MTACMVAFDDDELRRKVHDTYERVARAPASGFHFRTGAAYAVEVLGYDRQAVAALPPACSARFAGVGNPHRVAPIAAGAVVLDHACGAGMDLLLAAQAAGPAGRAIGVDMTPAMLEHAAAAAHEAGVAGRIELRQGLFEELPVADARVDVVISNGVVNLAPDKARVFAEVHRVLRPGGVLQLADVALSRELAPEARADPDLWAFCVGGALTEDALLAHVAAAGLVDARIVECVRCFQGTPLDRKFGKSLRVYAAALYARKPE
jgi:arsenite methyltransferase